MIGVEGQAPSACMGFERSELKQLPGTAGEHKLAERLVAEHAVSQ